VLPGPNPQKDWQVAISVGTFTNTTVDPNGYKIMGSFDPMTIDIENATVYFYYVDFNIGWKISTI
jgi:hypothetical protein